MEKKKVGKDSNPFDSLKNLNAVVSKNEIVSMLNNLQKIRQNLDGMLHNVRNSLSSKRVDIKPAVEESVPVKMTDENIPAKRDTTVLSETQKPSFREEERRPSFTPSTDNTNRQKPFERKPFTPRPFERNSSDGKPYTRPQYTNQQTGDRSQYSRPQGDRQPFNNTQRSGQYGDRKPPFAKPDYGDKKPFSTDRPGFRPDRPNFSPTFKRGDKPDFDRPSTGTARPFKPSTASASDSLFNKNKSERVLGNKQKDVKNDNLERRELNKKAKMKMGYIVENFEEEDEERIGRVRIKGKKKEVKGSRKERQVSATITTDNLTIKILAEAIGRPVTDIVKKGMILGLMLSINSPIDFETAELLAGELGVALDKKKEKTVEELLLEEFAVESTNNTARPPIVTVMGHVDHGKTSLLDSIKKTNVSASEAGGITQHIGAYTITVNDEKITFIDTPGHEAFTSMRARGAQITDVAILVVAADDGIMPQTIEAIKHIKEAQVPMVVAINKMDKAEANPDRVKQQLTEHNVVPEEWGGDAICVPVSALTGKGIDKLLEAVLLVAEVADLKADASRKGTGVVVESKVDKGRGVVATILVKDGSLNIGDYILVGTSQGRIRAMVDYRGTTVKVASPSDAVSVLGLDSVPDAGEIAYVTDEKTAKAVISQRLSAIAQQKAMTKTAVNIEEFLATNINEQLRNFNILIKADVQGSVEAVRDTLSRLKNEEVKVDCVHSAVGNINESDVLLAQASNAVIIAFNVKTEAKAKLSAEKNDVVIKDYKVIYEAVDFVQEKIDSMLTPIFEEKETGRAEIRKIFTISSLGSIAGCYVLSGFITRNSKAKLLRGNEEITDSIIENLQQGKNDAKQIKEGFECGIKLKNFNDIRELDIIKTYELVQVKRGK